MSENNYNIAIIGAGLAGLSAALRIEDSGHKTILIEAGDRPGGRIKTDQVDGFLLDRGFQVLLSEYQKAREFFDFDALKLGNFAPGAIITDDKGNFQVGDPRRDFFKFFPTVFSRVGSLGDKFKILKLGASLSKMNERDLFASDGSTMEYLTNLRFSQQIIQNFFAPFFGGIFLERKLETPASMFRFVFKLFANGNACLPADGMKALPEQLFSKLKSTEIRLNTKVQTLNQEPKITLSNGEIINAKKVIVACDPGQLLQQLDMPISYQKTITNYYGGPDSLKTMNCMIGLDARKNSAVNNYARHDEIRKSLAPKGKSLWSVTVRDGYDANPKSVGNSLAELINCKQEDLTFLKSYSIPQALPIITSPQLDLPPEQTQLSSHIHVAGDFLTNASIDGALRSGLRAAEAVVETLDVMN